MLREPKVGHIVRQLCWNYQQSLSFLTVDGGEQAAQAGAAAAHSELISVPAMPTPPRAHVLVLRTD